MEQVGRLWQEDRISVADEHLATALAESTLAALYPEFAWPVFGPRAIVACTEGERHQFGARMAADLLALDGWNVAFLGADVPSEALLERARRTQPVFVGLSVCLVFHLPCSRQTIAALRREAPEVRVLVGGPAAREIPDPAVFGADACALTADEGVRIARAWKP